MLEETMGAAVTMRGAPRGCGPTAGAWPESLGEPHAPLRRRQRVAAALRRGQAGMAAVSLSLPLPLQLALALSLLLLGPAAGGARADAQTQQWIPAGAHKYMFSCKYAVEKFSGDDTPGQDASDDGADDRLSFCEKTSWSFARMHPSYESQSPPLDAFSEPPEPVYPARKQDALAEQLFWNITGQNNRDGTADDDAAPEGSGREVCDVVAQRFACLSFFPECPLPRLDNEHGVTTFYSRDAAYLPPCDRQCHHVVDVCGDAAEAVLGNCKQYPETNCAVAIPTAYFYLDPDAGPYDPLVTLYAVMLALWTALTVLWAVFVYYVYKDSALYICSTATCAPVIKIITLSLQMPFWATCVKWGMCSFGIAVALINLHLFFETAAFLVFVLIANGWSITNVTVARTDWRGHLLFIASFYIGNCIVLIAKEAMNRAGWYSSNAILYGITLGFIVKEGWKQLKDTQRQKEALDGTYPLMCQEQTILKRNMYVGFAACVLVFAFNECLARTLLATESQFFVGMAVHETLELAVFIALGIIFRPREHSPFFYMQPATRGEVSNQERTQVLEAVFPDQQDEEDVLIAKAPKDGIAARAARADAAPSGTGGLLRMIGFGEFGGISGGGGAEGTADGDGSGGEDSRANRRAVVRRSVTRDGTPIAETTDEAVPRPSGSRSGGGGRGRRGDQRRRGNAAATDGIALLQLSAHKYTLAVNNDVQFLELDLESRSRRRSQLRREIVESIAQFREADIGTLLQQYENEFPEEAGAWRR